jgi:phytoene dehydrogenase-like protein
LGAGLAGLIAGARLAQRGHRVQLLDAAQSPGGRAISAELTPGLRANLGPHALYRQGQLAQALRSLQISLPKVDPLQAGQQEIFLPKLGYLPLPSSPTGVLRSQALSTKEKLHFSSTMLRWGLSSPKAHAHISCGRLLEDSGLSGRALTLAATTLRLVSYGQAPQRMSAEIALTQLQLSLRGVDYIHLGWSQMIDALSEQIKANGGELSLGKRAERLDLGSASTEASGLGVWVDGARWEAEQIIVALDPGSCRRLLERSNITPPKTAQGRGLFEDIEPLRAACLDVALARLPQGAVDLVLDPRAPAYIGLPSMSTKMGPAGQLLQAALYLDPDQPRSAAQCLEQLEASIKARYPDWRGLERARRYSPKLKVVSHLPSAQQGGLEARASIDALGLPGIWLAGDWIGAKGWLGDASAASALRAAEAVEAHADKLQRAPLEHPA